MAKKPLPSPEVLRQLLRYEPDTGKLFWIRRPLSMFPDDRAFRSWNTRFANNEAFTAKASGNLNGTLLGDSYITHRVAWAIYYGEWPDMDIDHINGDPCDNRIANLRLATHTENMRNRKINSNNKSGLKGVFWAKASKKWSAQICADKKRIALGFFETKEAAHEAYCTAADRLHGQFARKP